MIEIILRSLQLELRCIWFVVKNMYPFKDEAQTVYLKAQLVPRRKHFSSRL